MKQKLYVAKYRLDNILVEMKGIKAPDSFSEALAHHRFHNDFCFMRFLKPYKGFELEQLDGRPTLVGFEAADAWPD